MIHVIYHDNCYDGIAAAWAVREGLREQRGVAIEFHGARYGEEPPAVGGAEVIIVDFSYPRDVLEQLFRDASRLTVIDHHKSAEAELEGLPYCMFDMERSGAGMAWDWYSNKSRRPWFIDYIEDRDLWRFKLPDSQVISDYIQSLPVTLETMDALSTGSQNDARGAGRHIRRYIDLYNEKLLEQAFRAKLGSYVVWAVNAPYKSASEVAGKLAERDDGKFGVSFFRLADGTWQYSLRSRGDFDVSEVATKRGGGGHAGAAGFESDELVLKPVKGK